MENQNEVQDLSQANVVAGDQPVAQALGGAPTPSVLQPQIRLAGLWIRFVAGLIDLVILMIIQGNVIDWIIKSLTSHSDISNMDPISGGFILGYILFIPCAIINWAYFVWMTNSYQATLGKKAMGIKVVSEKMERATLKQLLMREVIGKSISFIILGIGYIIIGFTEKKQALHDMIAGTVVIYNDKKK